MEAFAAAHGIPVERCGKLIVASDNSELARLQTLHERGRANGVDGLRDIRPTEMQNYEPHVVGVRALHVASTGIMDFSAVAASLTREVTSAGADLILGRGLAGICQRVTMRLLTPRPARR